MEGARLRQELRADGERIEHADVMVAGVARALGVPIVTADRGFDRIDGLEVDHYRG